MTLDGLTLYTCVAELQEKCRDAKIQKVLMPGKEELVFQLYSAAEGTLRLTISADAGDCSAIQKRIPRCRLPSVCSCANTLRARISQI